MLATGVHKVVHKGYERIDQKEEVEEYDRTPENCDCIVVDKPPGEEQPGTDKAQRIQNLPTLPGSDDQDTAIEHYHVGHEDELRTLLRAENDWGKKAANESQHCQPLGVIQQRQQAGQDGHQHHQAKGRHLAEECVELEGRIRRQVEGGEATSGEI